MLDSALKKIKSIYFVVKNKILKINPNMKNVFKFKIYLKDRLKEIQKND